MTITPSTAAALLLVGLAIGVVSGMVGIGGGVLVIPVLMFAFGFSQARANGTSLAMLLPPVGLFAVLSYWRAGNVQWPVAALLAAGFAVGAYAGAKLVNAGWVNPTALRITFALVLLYCAGRILFRPGGRARSALATSLLMAGFALAWLAMRALGRRWEHRLPHVRAVYRRKLREPQGYDYEI
jgi:uncharacterized membrane protein YfcA